MIRISRLSFEDVKQHPCISLLVADALMSLNSSVGFSPTAHRVMRMSDGILGTSPGSDPYLGGSHGSHIVESGHQHDPFSENYADHSVFYHEGEGTWRMCPPRVCLVLPPASTNVILELKLIMPMIYFLFIFIFNHHDCTDCLLRLFGTSPGQR